MDRIALFEVHASLMQGPFKVAIQALFVSLHRHPKSIRRGFFLGVNAGKLLSKQKIPLSHRQFFRRLASQQLAVGPDAMAAVSKIVNLRDFENQALLHSSLLHVLAKVLPGVDVQMSFTLARILATV